MTELQSRIIKIIEVDVSSFTVHGDTTAEPTWDIINAESSVSNSGISNDEDITKLTPSILQPDRLTLLHKPLFGIVMGKVVAAATDNHIKIFRDKYPDNPQLQFRIAGSLERSLGAAYLETLSDKHVSDKVVRKKREDLIAPLLQTAYTYADQYPEVVLAQHCYEKYAEDGLDNAADAVRILLMSYGARIATTKAAQHQHEAYLRIRAMKKHSKNN